MNSTGVVFLVAYVVNAAFLSLLLFNVTFNLYSAAPDLEKYSSYECGFVPLSNARIRFDIKYYVVAILFIIFDIEMAFLFPWVVLAKQLDALPTAAVAVFLFVLTVGFVYE